MINFSTIEKKDLIKFDLILQLLFLRIQCCIDILIKTDLKDFFVEITQV